MLRFHNTLTKSEDEFAPIDTPVKLFVCGPTVYDYAHLGHAKTYTQFDVIARTLRYLGYSVTYLQNITDIDDKIIRRAAERGVEPEALAREYEGYYRSDMELLNNTSVDTYARATGYIPEIESQVKRLVKKGFAYKISDGYYFDIAKFADYGKLSGRTDLKAGDAVSRIDENPEKRNPGDFCLWKFKKDGEPFWPSELGDGRPGWHIEDTAITEAVFGPQYDIHGGAIDLIFPHHEAEIAQMESISGLAPMVRYWIHTGFLNTKSEKMSKSLGNSMTIRDMAEQYPPLALRYFFLGSHYRSPINFSQEALEAAENAYRKLKEFFASLPATSADIDDAYRTKFKSALENDFNMPEALAVVWEVVKTDALEPGDKRVLLLDFDHVLGLKLDRNEFAVTDVPPEVESLLLEREAARVVKNWVKSDEIREKIRARGYEVEDKESGQVLRKM